MEILLAHTGDVREQRFGGKGKAGDTDFKGVGYVEEGQGFDVDKTAGGEERGGTSGIWKSPIQGTGNKVYLLTFVSRRICDMFVLYPFCEVYMSPMSQSFRRLRFVQDTGQLISF